MAPYSSFRELLKKPRDNVMYWGEQMKVGFHLAKDIIYQLALDSLVYMTGPGPKL